MAETNEAETNEAETLIMMAEAYTKNKLINERSAEIIDLLFQVVGCSDADIKKLFYLGFDSTGHPSDKDNWEQEFKNYLDSLRAEHTQIEEHVNRAGGQSISNETNETNGNLLTVEQCNKEIQQMQVKIQQMEAKAAEDKNKNDALEKQMKARNDELEKQIEAKIREKLEDENKKKEAKNKKKVEANKKKQLRKHKKEMKEEHAKTKLAEDALAKSQSELSELKALKVAADTKKDGRLNDGTRTTTGGLNATTDGATNHVDDSTNSFSSDDNDLGSDNEEKHIDDNSGSDSESDSESRFNLFLDSNTAATDTCTNVFVLSSCFIFYLLYRHLSTDT